MGEIKQINIKNRTYYFYNDIINLDEFDGSKIKVDKKNLVTLLFIILAMNIRKKLQNVINKINSVNPLYLRITDMKGQFKKGKDDNVWYLIIFGDTDVSRIYANIWISIRAKIIKMIKNDKNYMRIKFERDDNLPRDRLVNISLSTTIIRSIFAQNNKFYPQLFLDDTLYEI